jgi:hypothetical protein
MLDRESQRDASAKGIAEHVGLRPAQLVQQRIEVVGNRLAPKGAAAQRRSAVALQVD